MKNKSLEDIVIGLKNQYKTGTYGSIRDGVYVKEILYEFEEVKLFDGKESRIMRQIRYLIMQIIWHHVQ